MDRRTPGRIVLFLALAWGWSPLAINAVGGGELPQLRVIGPEGRIITACNVSIIGEFKPAFTTHIHVRVFHVLPNGRVIPQAGCSFGARENGNFGVTIEPPRGG